MTDRYAGQRIALLTQHGQERVTAPVLEPAPACRVERIDAYDTDRLGSFAPDPVSGLFPWNIELLVLIDDRLGLEIVAVAHSAARSGHLLTADWNAVEAFAAAQGFPDHPLVTLK